MASVFMGLVGGVSVTKIPIAAFSRSTTCPKSLTWATPIFAPPLTEIMIFLASLSSSWKNIRPSMPPSAPFFFP
jgi:hypothetical protein